MLVQYGIIYFYLHPNIRVCAMKFRHAFLDANVNNIYYHAVHQEGDINLKLIFYLYRRNIHYSLHQLMF